MSLDSETAPELPLFDDRYRIAQAIGGGGFGNVYLAHDTTRRNKEVALKVLKLTLLDPGQSSEFARYFENEIEFMRTLSHPAIPRIINDGVTPQGENYFTMDFVKGQSLDKVLEAGPVDSDRVTRIFLQVLDVLEYAHKDKGIIHRDLKPKNIMLTETGDVRVLDFGIGKIISDYQNRVGDVSIGIVGTYDYMSPEQVLAQPLDGASDLYSLGVVVYEMLTRQYPFNGATSQERMVQRTSSKPTSLAKNVGTPELRDIVMRLLARSKADRPSIADVRKVLAPEIPKGSTMQVVPESSPASRVPWRLLAIGASVILIAVGYFYRCPLLGVCEKVPVSISILDQNGFDVPGIALFVNGSRDTLSISNSLGASMFRVGSNKRSLRLVEIASSKCYQIPEAYELTDADLDNERAVIRVEKTCSEKPNTHTLFVVSKRGARISIDGLDTGRRAPYGFPDLRPGEHRISITMPGFEKKDTLVVVSETMDTTRVVVNLVEKQPNIKQIREKEDTEPGFSKTYQFSTSPMVAEVYVDGETTNSADAFGKFNRALKAGKHTFRVKAGFTEAVLSYTVTVGDPNGVLVLDYQQGQVKASRP